MDERDGIYTAISETDGILEHGFSVMGYKEQWVRERE